MANSMAVMKMAKHFKQKGGKEGKVMEKYTIPEIGSDLEWLYLTGQTARVAEKNAEKTGHLHSNQRFSFNPIKAKQILLVDIYSSWSGPCSAMESHLRRMRHQFVATPDCLALAKACSDSIEDLSPFKSDPRPTFLFWARGKPVALLRGANRPLLTRLVERQVEIEVSEMERNDIEIDFNSHRVIQCEGDLALLDEDEVVHSIGSGSTEMLTSFFNNEPKNLPMSKKKSVAENPPKIEEPKQQKEENTEKVEKPVEKETAEPEIKEEKPENKEENKDKEEVEEEDKEEEEQMEEQSTTTDQGFGVKKTKKAKKMETGLLKEILDAKPAKRYGI